MNAEFPALLLARMQILTMGLSALPLYLSGYTKGLDQTSSLLRGRRALQWRFMKARVYVSIKPTVLDPQGQTIRSALAGLGHAEIATVRQGKFFEIGLHSGVSREQAQRSLDEIARDVLSNPVIEDYRVEILD
ncbi:MAG TPA: phosphoribosylformylglycinamidine synthase subunit PurS [Bryobacteraceae bacterium]